MSADRPRIYLDHNATTPLAPEALAAMMPFLQGEFANPSSAHASGRRVRDAVETARRQVGALVGAKPSQVTFTSGATEALNTVIRGVGGHMVASAVEHPAVLKSALDGTRAPVDASGRVDPATFAAAVRPDTRLIATMRVNNETGNLYDTAAIAAAARAVNPAVLVLVDAVQAAGRIELALASTGADYLVISAHKMNGPKGVGALITRRGAPPIEALVIGGPQERGRRGGTENVAGIVGFGAATALPRDDEELSAVDRVLRRHIGGIEGLHVHGDPDDHAPGTLNVRFDGVEGETLLIELDLAGVSASSGSACATGDKAPSHVLTAMGLTAGQAYQSIRLSCGRSTSRSDVDRAGRIIADVIARLRS